MNNIYSLEKPHIIYRDNFPVLLQQLPDPPQKLLIAGNIDLLYKDSIYLCVIGSRKYTDYGKSVCTSFIQKLKGLPVVIVSGLALGIDSLAHKAALSVGLPTIAVPGSGIHPSVLYPYSHYGLAKDIIAAGGIVLSEFEHTSPAGHWTFPIRNRIMAGLSQSILIIEAEEDSGTLITANLALQYNRDVLTVPGSIYSSTSRGPLGLLKKGAIPIGSVEDLIEALGFSSTKVSELEVQTIYSLCSKEEKTVLGILKEPKTRNQIFEQARLPISQLQVILSMLEIRKMIKEEGGYIHVLHKLPKDLDLAKQ